MSETIEYYNANAEAFCDSTSSVEMSELYDEFEQYLKAGGYILDCGCGSGRDSKHFIESGYNVTAIDGSSELCNKASQLIGQPVQCVDFMDIASSECFDGIWACASILHLPKKDLPIIFLKFQNALHDNGVLYVSFKYGEYEGMRNGRYFTDLTEQALEAIVEQSEGMNVIKMWISTDVRPGRSEEKWLNAIIKKDM